MDVRALCPLPTATLLFRPREGRHALSLVCKATYRLAPGTSLLAPEQEPIQAEEMHWNGNPAQSLDRPTDLVPYKPRVDVVLVGSAFAPQRSPVRSLVVRLGVAELDKSIEVFCPRTMTNDGVVREGMSWLSMPLRYERASGGSDTWNPVGIPQGVDAGFGTRVVPQIVPAGYFAQGASQPIPPAGFGPIAATWAVRREKLGARGATWVDRDLDKVTLGDDFDATYFQVAPRDQQIEALRPDERIILENAHPEHPRLATNLPGLLPKAFASLPGAAPSPLALRADTLWIDTDRGICCVTFRGQIPLASPTQPGVIYVVMQEPGREVSWADVQAKLRPLANPGGAVSDSWLGMAPLPAPEAKATTSARDELRRTQPVIAYDPETTTEIRADTLPRQKPVMPFTPFGRRDALPDFSDDDDDEKGTAIRDVGALRSEQEKRHAEQTKPPPQPEERTREISIASLFGQKPIMPFGAGGNVATAPPMNPPPAALPVAPPMTPPMAPPPSLAGPPRPAPTMGLAGAPPMPPPPAMVAPAFGPPPAMTGFGPTNPSPPSLGVLQRAPAPKPVSLGETDGKVMSAASYEGVLAASNAAAGPGSPETRDSNVPPAPRKPVEDKPTARAPGEPIELLWYESSHVARMRKHPAWAPLFRPSPKTVAPQRGQAPPPPPSPEALEEATKADVFSVLSRAEPAREQDLVPGRTGEASDGGEHDAALYLLSGTIVFPFDEIETLKATARAAAPLAATDKKLKEVLDMVDEVMKMPLEGAPEVVQSFTVRVRDAWSNANRILPPDYLVTHTERTLLNQRHYQKRELLDDEWIRALFGAPGGAAQIPAYVPSKLAKRLPLFRQFSARLVVEALPQQDMYESHPIALRVAALARVLAPEPSPQQARSKR